MIYSDFETYIMVGDDAVPCNVTFEYIAGDNDPGGMCEEINIKSLVVDGLLVGTFDYMDFFDADNIADIEGIKSRCLEYLDSL